MDNSRLAVDILHTLHIRPGGSRTRAVVVVENIQGGTQDAVAAEDMTHTEVEVVASTNSQSSCPSAC